MSEDKCDPEVYENGTVVFVTHTIRAARVEEWVQAVARRSGQRVDWSSFAGRFVVRYLGDGHEVRASILALRDMHDAAYREALAELRMLGDGNDSQGVWNYNAYLLVGAKEELGSEMMRLWQKTSRELAETRAERDAAVQRAERAERERDALRQRVDGAYNERDRVLSVMAKMAAACGFSTGLARHPESEPWDDDWRTIVFVDLPTGQSSWHIHDSEKHLFDSLTSYSKTWDGHSTEEKYRRCEEFSRRSVRPYDDPELDATDGAHPAWWRGHDHAARGWRDLADRKDAELKELQRELENARNGLVPTTSRPTGGGDCDEVCTACDEVVTEPHTIYACAGGLQKRLAGAVDNAIDLTCERDNLRDATRRLLAKLSPCDTCYKRGRYEVPALWTSSAGAGSYCDECKPDPRHFAGTCRDTPYSIHETIDELGYAAAVRELAKLLEG